MLDIGYEMENYNRKVNWFVRILIILFCILLVLLILYKFFYVIPKGEINSGFIVLLLILLVLILSESFDQFSIGKLFSMSRNIKRKEEKVQKLEKEKMELFNQLINISISQKQSQSTYSFAGGLHVAPSKIEEFSTDITKGIGFTIDIPNAIKEED